MLQTLIKVKKQNKFLNIIKKRYFCIPKLLLR